MTGFAIETPLPDRFRDAAAALYLDAFGGKIGWALGRGDRARAYLSACLAPDKGIAAVTRDGADLLGVAGIQDHRGGFVAGGLEELTAHYGAVGGALRGLALSVLEREAGEGVLQMDGICVAPQARGQGVGGALLRAVTAEARSRGLQEVRLEVIDTNPRAAALYRRFGFEEVGRSHLGPLRHVFGFRSAATMALRV